jgi:hypothetical protein
MLKKWLFGIAALCYSSSSFAQTNTAQPSPVGLQHSLMAHTLYAFNSSFNLTGGGLNYDLRFRTPNPRIDWSIGASVGLSNIGPALAFAKFNQYVAKYKGLDWNYISLHPAILFGRKAVVFELGLDVQYGHWATVTKALYDIDSDELTLRLPLGVRYQTPKDGLYASLRTTPITSTGFLADSPVRFVTVFWYTQLTLGYSFATQPHQANAKQTN